MKWQSEIKVTKEVTDSKIHILVEVKSGINKGLKFEKEVQAMNGQPTQVGAKAVMARTLAEWANQEDISTLT